MVLRCFAANHHRISKSSLRDNGLQDLTGSSLPKSSTITKGASGDDSTECTLSHDSYNILRLRCEQLHWFTLLQADLTTNSLGSMGANIRLLTGRQHQHLHSDRNHDRGPSRTLQRLRISIAVCTFPFARDICNLLTLCTSRADSWIVMPTARVVA